MEKSCRIVIIDNHDSFTYNLVETFRSIGLCTIEVISSDMVNIDALSTFDGIVLSPGPGMPSERTYFKPLLDYYGGKKPIFGVCLGHQAIVEYFGGTLVRLERIVHGESSVLELKEESVIYSNLGPNIETGRYHSWAASVADFPDCLQITAYSENDIIMSAKHKSLNIQSVQFHPESILTPKGKQMLENWLRFCVLKKE